MGENDILRERKAGDLDEALGRVRAFGGIGSGSHGDSIIIGPYRNKSQACLLISQCHGFVVGIGI
jgi:hypothetical protein